MELNERMMFVNSWFYFIWLCLCEIKLIWKWINSWNICWKLLYSKIFNFILEHFSSGDTYIILLKALHKLCGQAASAMNDIHAINKIITWTPHNINFTYSSVISIIFLHIYWNVCALSLYNYGWHTNIVNIIWRMESCQIL